MLWARERHRDAPGLEFLLGSIFARAQATSRSWDFRLTSVDGEWYGDAAAVRYVQDALRVAGDQLG